MEECKEQNWYVDLPIRNINRDVMDSNNRYGAI